MVTRHLQIGQRAPNAWTRRSKDGIIRNSYGPLLENIPGLEYYVLASKPPISLRVSVANANHVYFAGNKRSRCARRVGFFLGTAQVRDQPRERRRSRLFLGALAMRHAMPAMQDITNSCFCVNRRHKQADHRACEPTRLAGEQTGPQAPTGNGGEDLNLFRH